MKFIDLFLVFFLLVGLVFGKTGKPQPDSTLVKFTLRWEKPAKTIALIGDFNNFSKNADLLEGSDSAGVWSLDKKLPYGRHEYRFLIDGSLYLRDPDNPHFGGLRSNSVLDLDPPRVPHIRILSPLPGARVEKLPLHIQIQFFPGSQTKKVNLKSSSLLIDGRPRRMLYDKERQLLTGSVGNLDEGEHTLKVEIRDNKKNATHPYTSIFLVNARNTPPVSDAGYACFVAPGDSFRLDGGLSYDSDLDDIVDYQWRLIGNNKWVHFDSSQSTPFPRLWIEKEGDYEFTLRVSDGRLWSVPDTGVVYCRRFQSAFAHFSVQNSLLLVPDSIFSLSVAGEFNRWQADADKMRFDSTEQKWGLNMPLMPGQYEYKFVINGNQWIPDPGNPFRVADGWRGFNSVMEVPPLFARKMKWMWELLPDGLSLTNQPPWDFTVLSDTTPSRPEKPADRFISLNDTGGGSLFYYALAESSSVVRPPKYFLINNEGNGESNIIDFDASPGWSRSAMTYQVFLRAFGADSGHSGTLRELRHRLDYLQDLGINAVWLMPIMKSPTEHGYTPTNYFKIEPDYGTMADFDSLIADLHSRGMKFIFDFVANHSSDQHPYFLSAWWNPKSAFRNWYIWQGPREYEFHNDWDQLPNLNYDNPNVRHFILKVAKFWIDHGVDGFRCDAAWGVPHSFWKDFRRKVKSWNPQVVLLDEVLPRSPDYHRQEFDMSYDTDFYGNLLDLFRGRKTVRGLRFGLEKTRKNYPPEVVDLRYMENQDMQRFAGQFGFEAARAAAVLLYTLPGMPLMYYGQEIGMKEQRGHMRWDQVGNSSFLFYKELLRLRKENPALSSDNINFLNTSLPDSVLAYTREKGKNKILVVINFSRLPQDIKILEPGIRLEKQLLQDSISELIPPVSAPYSLRLNRYGYFVLRIEAKE